MTETSSTAPWGAHRWSAAIAAAFLAAVAVGCASGATPPPAPEPGEKSAYVIGAGDMIGIRVWKNPELSVDVPVRPDGQISVPLVDEVQAEGLTTAELKQVLSRSLEEYISNPDVTVLVRQVNSKRAYVIGAVRRSGPISLSGNVRVLDAISTAGGFTEFAERNEVKVIRPTEDGDEEYLFRYDDYVSGEAPRSNMHLQPGDTIVVPD